MLTSPAGRAAIMQREGCRLLAYRDSKGVWTIGVGHVAPVEVEHADAIQAHLADLADARAMNVQLVQTGSPIAWATPAVAFVATLGFLTIAAYLCVVGDATVRNSILLAATAGWTTVLNFYLGSFEGGSERAEQITSMLRQTISTGVPAVKPAPRR